MLRFLLLLLIAIGPAEPGATSGKAQKGGPTPPQLLGKERGLDGYATVSGTVCLARTSRPLAGVLLALQTCSFGYFGALCGDFTGDSTRTDAQGYYELRFYPQANASYVIRFDPGIGRSFGQASRFMFSTNARLVGPDGKPDSREVSSKTVTTADFAPDFAPSYSRPIDLRLPPAGH